MNKSNNWKSTKFFLSVLCEILLFILTCMRVVDGIGFISGTGTILLFYSGFSVAEKKLLK